jgi:hypothetical protein
LYRGLIVCEETFAYSRIFSSNSIAAILIAVNSAVYTLCVSSVPIYSSLMTLLVGEYIAAPICPPWPDPSVYIIRSCAGIC